MDGSLGIIVPPLLAAIGWLWRETRKLHRQHSDCETKMAGVEAELARLAAIIEERHGEDAAAIVVADGSTGLISEWSPGATVLFHWTMKEAFGKPVTWLIPARYLEQHGQGWQRVQEGKSPKRGPVQAHAKTKEGTEVPITITYSAWEDRGKRMVAAHIRRRSESELYQV